MNESVRVEVERYLAGAMSDPEAAAFLKSLEGDPEALAWLGRVLEDQAYLFDAARAHEGTVAPTKNHHSTRPPKRRRLRLWHRASPRLGVAWIAGLTASALALIGAAISLSTSPAPSAPREAAAPDVVIEGPAESLPLAAGERASPSRPVETLPPAPETPRVPEWTPPPPRREESEVPRIEEPRVTPPLTPEADRRTFAAAPPKIAELERVEGICFVLDGARRTPAEPPRALTSGQGLESGEAGGLAVVRFFDGTRLEIAPGTRVTELTEKPGEGKRVFLAEGQLRVNVMRQPRAQSMIFETPHAEAKVLGTTLRLVVDRDPKRGTRLDVIQGTVQFKRKPDGKMVDVPSGHFVVGAVGVEMVLEKIAREASDIALVAQRGLISGSGWRLQKDPATSSGWALEARQKSERSYVTFTFQAEANQDYYVWMRGRTLTTWAEDNPGWHDCVRLEFQGAKVTDPQGLDKQKAELGIVSFNGWAFDEGYWWISGNADDRADVAPVAVRFSRSGTQGLKVFAVEAPVRLDAIWLSPNQRTRPEKSQAGPGDKGAGK